MANPHDALGTWSSRRINQLASRLSDPTSYVEVGVEEGLTLEAVDLPFRVGVDPRPRFSLKELPSGVVIHVETSDKFFLKLDANTTFDLMFLDGLHTYEQTYRDLINSLRHIAHRGFILIDDVVPSDELSSRRDEQEVKDERARRGDPDTLWHGDVFRLMLVLRDHHPELTVRTIVGSGNEQALVWKAVPSTASVPIDDKLLDHYRTVYYGDVFSEGIPTYFRPGTEDEVLHDAEGSIAE